MGQLYHLTPKRTDNLIKIVLKLSDRFRGNVNDQAFVINLDQDLRDKVKSSPVSRYEGFHCGFGKCIYWVYTGDLEQTLAEILPLFKYRVFNHGSYYVKVDPGRRIWDSVSLD
ncbi:MAG TPA: hypothetical protein VIM29_02365 [Bacillota bacterium]